MKLKLNMLLLFLILAGNFLNAQQIIVTGYVSDASGRGIEGANLSIGVREKVLTNSSGAFTIEGAKGEKVSISAYGYTSKSVTINSDLLDITLQASAGDLGDVVVVGYGSQKRTNITSAVGTVKGDQLIKRPLASTSMALQGFVTGVVVQQGSGQPGVDGGSIVIRGLSSINGNTAPLLIIDGVEGGNINDVDPNIIESISVLKDAASTAVYGVRGTNGVILVKTKRGQSGKTSISYNSFLSQQTPTNFPKLLSSVDHMLLSNEAVSNTGSTILPFSAATINQYQNSTADNLNVFNSDWKDLIFQNSGIMQNHNLIVQGGSDKASFLASGTFLNQQGLVVNNSFKKYDLRLNGDINVTRKIKFTTDLFYTKSTNIQPAGMAPNEIIQRGISMARLFPAKFGNGFYGDAGQSNRINPVAAAENSGINKAETPTLSARFGLSAELFKDFVIEASYNNRTSFTEAYVARGTYNSYNPNPSTSTYVFANVIGDSALSYTNSRNNTNQYGLSGTYSYKIKTKHQLRLQAGFQGLDNTASTVGATRQGLIDPYRPYLNLATSALQPTVSGSASDFSIAGFYGKFNYNYDQKYLLELTGRYDGSSRFSQLLNKQWGFFPGVSAGWVISKERFMEKVSVIDYAKLRLSYGKIGNQEGIGNYPFVAQLNAGTAYYYNNLLSPGSSLGNIPNESVSWENSSQSNIGLDIVLLKNKLSVTFDVYKKKITDMLIDFPVANALGYAGNSSIPANAASMVNNGWEFSTTYKNRVGKFNYSVTANLSDVKNKVLDTRSVDIVQGNQISRAGNSIRSYNLFKTNGLYKAGDDFSKPYYAARPNTGAGDVKYVDLDGNDTINAKDRVLTGNNFPRYDYSLNMNVDYGSFDLNVFLFGVGKRDNYISGIAVEPFNGGNWIASGLESALERYTPTKTDAKYPRLYSGGNSNYVASDFWLRNGSFMRIKHVTLGYSMPRKIATKLKLQQFRIYVNAVNPFTFSNYEPGFDPEVANTNGSFYPIMKTYTVGINLKF